MGRHVIVGAGPVGTATAEHLYRLGHEVRVITRGGSGPSAVERMAADATDAGRLAALASGADALYNCAAPAYHRWPQEWPPLARALLSAAERTGALLVTMNNLYGYGPVSGPITEDLPLAATHPKLRTRADLWLSALAAHEAGRAQVTEARASDFIGPGAKSFFTAMVVPRVRTGRPASVPADLDVPHSLTYVGDAAATLAVLGTDRRALGRPWHVPTAPAVSLREAATRFAAVVGAPPPRVTRMSDAVLRIGGLFNSDAREFRKVSYQFESPWVLDSSAAQATFGLAPTPLEDALRSMA